MPTELRQWGEAILDFVVRYHEGIRDRRLAPDTTSREIRAVFDRTLPEEGVGFAATLEDFEERLLPFARHNGHPRMFGYVQSPGVAIGSLADLLASTLNANITAWRSAPGQRMSSGWCSPTERGTRQWASPSACRSRLRSRLRSDSSRTAP